MIRKRFFLRSFLIAIALFVLVAFAIHFSTAQSNANIIDKKPITVIEQHESGINHPEGIAFSSSGDFIAVANALGNTITFYKKLDDTTYETTPYFTLKNPEAQLSYPHDLSFSPDGYYLAVANSLGTVNIYKKNPDCSFYDLSPAAIIKCDLSTLKNPHAVKYSPVENIIAVADVLKNIVSLYRYQNEKYEQIPYQIIQDSNGILNKPDGLAFSSDGELLAVTSHANHSVVFYQQIPNSQGLYSPDPVEILQGEQTNFCFTHSVSFHPTNDYLAVSSASGKYTLSIFKKTSENFPRYSIFPEQTLEIYNPKNFHLRDQFPEEGGVKGIAFSPDGKQLSICASDIADPGRKILILNLKSLSSK